MTKFTAVEYPQFVSYHGMVLPENRELMAELFKRPTTFLDYCEQVSLDNCTTPDDVAQRAPLDETEVDRMFLKDVYTGHFRYTEKNNCTLFQDNCTGHAANYPCGWTTNMEVNTYHLGIPLDPNNGPNGGPGGYTQSQLMEMWDAANATHSHLIMFWWFPEPLVQRFAGTDAEFQRVVLPPYTFECAQAFDDREDWNDSCGNLTERVGYPEEACEWPTEPLRKMITGNLNDVLSRSPQATQNPAYDTLRLFQMSELQLGQLFDLRESEETPRDAACTWLANNFELVSGWIPPTFPRTTREDSQSELAIAVLILGIASAVFVVFSTVMVYHKRTKASVRFAQLDFLYILLSGAFSVSFGSIMTSLPASSATCTAGIWFVHLGYTLELVPLIIKAAALNTMLISAHRLRRVTLSRRKLHGAVVLIGFVIAVYLAVWTAVDPPRKVAEFSFSSETRESKQALTEFIVNKIFYCSGGESDAWAYSGLGWNALLLLCASVLAFQTRNIKQDFNESRTLAFLIYSHSVFVVLRIGTYLLSEYFEGSTLRYMRGMLYAVDQIAACIIYFIPKFFSQDNHHEGSTMFGLNSPALDTGSAGARSIRRGSRRSDQLLNAREEAKKGDSNERSMDEIPTNEQSADLMPEDSAA